MYNYYEAVRRDLENYIESEHIDFSEHTFAELSAKLYEDCFLDDAVTGNGSGSYTFNAKESSEYVADNFDLLGDVIDEFGLDARDLLKKGSEAIDVAIRCYVLSDVIYDLLTDHEDELRG